jgi:hypothetical protein
MMFKCLERAELNEKTAQFLHNSISPVSYFIPSIELLKRLPINQKIKNDEMYLPVKKDSNPHYNKRSVLINNN